MFKLIIMSLISILLGTACFRISGKEIFEKSKAKINLLGIILYAIGLVIIVGIIANLVLSIIFKVILIVVVIAFILAVVIGIKKLK